MYICYFSVLKLVRTTKNIGGLRPVFEPCTIPVVRCSNVQTESKFLLICLWKFHIFFFGCNIVILHKICLS